MARPPQFQRREDDGDTIGVAQVKDALKRLSPENRAYVLAWLTKYYNDGGDMFPTSTTRNQRRRVAIDGEQFWLVKVPTR
jgi:hypothetical protein